MYMIIFVYICKSFWKFQSEQIINIGWDKLGNLAHSSRNSKNPLNSINFINFLNYFNIQLGTNFTRYPDTIIEE